MATDVIDAAYDIAVRDLKSNYGSIGLYAGPTHHKDYWSRDSFIMTPGVCSLGDFGVVRRNLELFKTYQKSDGHLPLRVEEQSHSLAQLGIVRRHRRLDVRFKSSALWADAVVDSCPSTSSPAASMPARAETGNGLPITRRAFSRQRDGSLGGRTASGS